jgi:carbonic anhydrase/acetyltransferase-like protein (isoleucine patch superfamily)
MALVKPFEGFMPVIGQNVRLAENATIVGDVELGDGLNLWYGGVIRGDVGKVRIGKNANLQDLCCVHMTKYRSDAILGESVSVGHSAIIHGAVVEDGVLIGMGAIVMDNAVIGEQSIVGAGSLVTQGVTIPPRSLVMGRPARVIRPLDEEEVQAGRKTAERYLGLASSHFEVYAPG